MSDPLVLKIGAVIVHPVTGEVLIVQPYPKIAGEVPPFVLPRGSRQYSVMVDDALQWHDARDEETGEAHAANLEPYRRGLEREVYEEAGITPQQLQRAEIHELGSMPFQSRSKGVYPIQWFVVIPDKATADQVGKTLPPDAMDVQWASHEHISQMDPASFSQGYLPVIKQALARLAEQQYRTAAVSRSRN